MTRFQGLTHHNVGLPQVLGSPRHGSIFQVCL
jgi:hypothetical protein